MSTAPLRASPALLAASASMLLVFGVESIASAQSRHVRVAGRLIPEHASVAPEASTPAPRHTASTPAHRTHPHADTDAAQALPPAAENDSLPHRELREPSTLDEIPETE